MKKTLLLLAFAILLGAMSPAFAKRDKQQRANFGREMFMQLVQPGGDLEAAYGISLSKKEYKNIFQQFYPSDYFYVQALIRCNIGEMQCANSYIDSAITTHKAKAYATLQMLQELKLCIVVKNKSEISVAEIEKFLTTYPDAHAAYMLRAGVYAKMQQWESAAADYRKVIELASDTASTARVELAKILIEQGNKSEALGLLNDCAERCPSYAPTYRVRANLLYAMGEGRKAVGDVVNFALNNDQINLLDFKEIIRANLHSFAAAALAKANEYDCDHPSYLKWMAARAYDWAKLYKESAQLSEEIFEQNNYYSKDLCFAYFELGLYEDAVKFGKFFDEIYGENDSEISTLGAIGSAYHALGKYEEAIEYYTKAYERQPMEHVYHQMRATTYLHMNDTVNAMKYFKAALELNPQDTVSLFFRGIVYRKMGRIDKANADFQEFLKNSSGVANKMLVQFYMGNKERGLRLCDSLLLEDPFDRVANYSAACLYSNLNDKPKALAYLRKAFECGARDFEHIEWDFDLDNIKELPEFKAMIEEFKAKPLYIPRAKLPNLYDNEDQVNEESTLTIL